MPKFRRPHHRLVIALGGNALASSSSHDLESEAETLRLVGVGLVRLLESGEQIVVTHGNGPQVGDILMRAQMCEADLPQVSLDTAVAMSQGEIGYRLATALGNVFAEQDLPIPVCCVLTRVVVDPKDVAFGQPTKPIGRFYTKGEAEPLGRKHGWTMVEDAGRGYRRVVPSPKPCGIVEWPVIKSLVHEGMLVIATGGGGIPVAPDPDGRLQGIEGVVDKDLASEQLASLLEADTLVMLTAVENASASFGSPEARPLHLVSAREMQDYLDRGEFPPGSMGPKVEAALKFLEHGGRRVVITSIECVFEAVKHGTRGTQIVAQSEFQRLGGRAS